MGWHNRKTTPPTTTHERSRLTTKTDLTLWHWRLMQKITTLIAAIALTALTATPALATTKEPPAINPAGIVEGQQPSAYRGKHFIASQEPYRICVAQREGRHQYWITGSNGFYLGTYQMTHELARGAVWMITPELRQMFGDKKGREIRDQLHNTKPTKWNRFYWDMAFYTILNWEHPGSGQHHWRGGRFSCTLGMQHSVGNQ